jgi:hypothetical protein
MVCFLIGSIAEIGIVIFIDIGVWDYVDKERTAPLEDMQVCMF